MSALSISFVISLCVFFLLYLIVYTGLLDKHLPRVPITGALLVLVMWVSGAAAVVLVIIMATKAYYGV